MKITFSECGHNETKPEITIFFIYAQRWHTGFKLTQVLYKYQMTIGPVKAYQKLGKFEYFIHVNSQSFKGHELDINNINTLFYIFTR